MTQATELVEVRDSFLRAQADHWLPDFDTRSLDARHASLLAALGNAFDAGLASTAALRADNERLREALEACELGFVTAGSIEVGGEPCRVIASPFVIELLGEIWKVIPSHDKRDPAMNTIDQALATQPGEHKEQSDDQG